MKIELTNKAVTEVKRIAAEQSLPLDKVALRIRIVGGGCSGFSTKLDLDESFDENKDFLDKIEDVNIAVDKRSALYLDGAKVDFINEGLSRIGFFVDVPQSTGRCGCGSSFSM